MTQFSNVYQVALLSSVAGAASVVIVPQAMFNPAIPVGPTYQFYPWVNLNSTTPLTPFTNNLMVAAPFATTNTTIKAPDITNVRFLNTMNDLQSSGKLIVSVFYEPLAQSWALPLTPANATFA